MTFRGFLYRIGLEFRGYAAQRAYYEGKLADMRRLVDHQQGTITALRAENANLKRAGVDRLAEELRTYHFDRHPTHDPGEIHPIIGDLSQLNHPGFYTGPNSPYGPDDKITVDCLEGDKPRAG